MENLSIKEKVVHVLDTLGMSGKKAAEAMGVTHATFRKKKMDSDPTHNFNQKNLDDLVAFIKQKVEEIETSYVHRIVIDLNGVEPLDVRFIKKK